MAISGTDSPEVPTMVICYVTMERSTILNGKIHYKSPFSIAMLNYQRVPIPYIRPIFRPKFQEISPENMA